MFCLFSHVLFLSLKSKFCIPQCKKILYQVTRRAVSQMFVLFSVFVMDTTIITLFVATRDAS